MALERCTRCRVGVYRWVRYANGDGLMWDDSKGKPHYVYQCNNCGAEVMVPVGRTWDREHPDALKFVGPGKSASYADKWFMSGGLWRPRAA